MVVEVGSVKKSIGNSEVRGLYWTGEQLDESAGSHMRTRTYRTQLALYGSPPQIARLAAMQLGNELSGMGVSVKLPLESFVTAR